MGALGLVFDWDVIFQKLTVQLCLGFVPNYLTRIDHHKGQYHQGYETKNVSQNVMLDYRVWFRGILLSISLHLGVLDIIHSCTHNFLNEKLDNNHPLTKQMCLTINEVHRYVITQQTNLYVIKAQSRYPCIQAYIGIK